MSERTRIGLALLLIFLSFFITGDTTNNNKLRKPTPEIQKLVDELPEISNDLEASRMAGVFEAMYENFPSSIKTNFHLQKFIAYVGKEIFGDQLKGRYSLWSKKAAELITKVAGPQTEKTELTEAEKANVVELLHGFAHRLYRKKYDEEFEKYKNLAAQKIAEYNKENTPDDDITECTCNGTGYITHGDGHKTKCPCESCECKPKDTVKEKESFRCRCFAPGYVCACEDEYGVCECPKLPEGQRYSNCSGGS